MEKNYEVTELNSHMVILRVKSQILGALRCYTFELQPPNSTPTGIVLMVPPIVSLYRLRNYS